MSRTARSQLPREVSGKRSVFGQPGINVFTDVRQPRSSYLRVSFSSFQLLRGGGKQEESDEVGRYRRSNFILQEFFYYGERRNYRPSPRSRPPRHGIQPRRAVYTHFLM